LDYKKKKNEHLADYLEDQENEVAKLLVEKHGSAEDGIIGLTKIDTQGGVKRKPSSVYWNAFRQFRIIETEKALYPFCKEYEYASKKPSSERVDVEDGSDNPENVKNKVRIPSYDTNWKENLFIDLTFEEATFIRDKILESPLTASSVPTQLFKHGLLDKALLLSANEKTEDDEFDLLTSLLKESEGVSIICKENIAHSNQFSLAMQGANIRYNIVLAKKNGLNEKVAEYEEIFDRWLKKVKNQELFKDGVEKKWFKIAHRAHTGKFKHLTKTFVENWVKAMQAETPDLKELDKFVENQAKENKKDRSLLNKKIRAENLKWVGAERLDYRWPNAKRILKDIQKGLLDARPRS
jgi:hypothetical protein